MNIGIIIIISIVVFLFLIIFAFLKYNADRFNQRNLIKLHNFLVESYLNSNNHGNNHGNKLGNIPVYYINLDKSKDRKEFMEKQFEIYNIKATRIPAIYGKSLNNKKDYINLSTENEEPKRVQFENNFTNNTVSELGCTLSHLKAIFNAYKNGDEYALILEDDASLALCPYWPVTLHDIIKDAPKDFTVIILFNCHSKTSESDYLKFNVNNPYSGSVSYLINRKGMENVLHDLINGNKFVFSKKLDHSLVSDVLNYHRAKNVYYYTKHTLIYPYNDTDLIDSTIHPSHTATHVKRSLEMIYPYIIKTKKKIFIKRCSTDLTSKIPKVIHIIWYKWKSDEPPDDMKEMLKICNEVNKDFEYKLWDETMGLNLIKNHYPWFLETYNSYDVEIKRIDAIRYFILFHYGGIYMDIDTICLKNISPLLKDGYAIFGYQLRNKNADGSICNSFMATVPRHPLFEYIVYRLLDTSKNDVLSSTGPYFLTNEVKKYSRKDGVTDVLVYDMHILFTSQWNDINQIASKCIKDTSLCKEKFPNTYITTVFAHSWK